MVESNSISTMTPNSLSAWTRLPLLFICCSFAELGFFFFLAFFPLLTVKASPANCDTETFPAVTSSLAEPCRCCCDSFTLPSSQNPAPWRGLCSGSQLYRPGGSSSKGAAVTYPVLAAPFPQAVFPASAGVNQQLRSSSWKHFLNVNGRSDSPQDKRSPSTFFPDVTIGVFPSSRPDPKHIKAREIFPLTSSGAKFNPWYLQVLQLSKELAKGPVPQHGSGCLSLNYTPESFIQL